MKKPNRSYPLLIIAVVMLTFVTSCGKKDNNNDIIIEPVAEKKAAPGIQEMEPINFEETIDWQGSTYTIKIERSADKNLNKTADDAGNTYYDNRINVKILRGDGSSFFNKSFTKSDFAKILDADKQKKGALLGLMFYKTDGDKIIFEGSVGSPDALSEDFIPFTLIVNRQGNINISRSTIIDTSSDDELNV